MPHFNPSFQRSLAWLVFGGQNPIHGLVLVGSRLPISEPVAREAGMGAGEGNESGSRATAPAMAVILAAEDEIRGEPGGLVRRADGGPAESAALSTGRNEPTGSRLDQKVIASVKLA